MKLIDFDDSLYEDEIPMSLGGAFVFLVTLIILSPVLIPLSLFYLGYQ